MNRVYMLEMARSDVFNGVSRSIQALMRCLADDSGMEVAWLRLLYWGDSRTTLRDVERVEHCFRYLLPYGVDTFLSDKEKREQCWVQILNRYFTDIPEGDTLIFHVHTLNLIELACFLQTHLGGHIITHLHCIPWKSLYDRNQAHYKKLYYNYYIEKQKPRWEDFIYADYERKAYLTSDALVCVTYNARDFLLSLGLPENKVHWVANGLPDVAAEQNGRRQDAEVPTVLFVGNANPSKGLELLLEGLTNLRQRALRIVVAGLFDMATREHLLNRFPQLDIRFVGQTDLETLSRLYTQATAGVIPSAHEQCSCVAIEMMMHGLPLVCSSVDGLDEMFQHEITALKVPLSPAADNPYTPDGQALAQALVRLLADASLRHRLSCQVRTLYESDFTDTLMREKMRSIYSLLTS